MTKCFRLLRFSFYCAFGFTLPLHAQVNHFDSNVQAIALGGSLVSQVRNPSALFWNPALLSALKDRELYLGVNEVFEFSQLNFTQFIPSLGTFGFALTRIATDAGDVRGGTFGWGQKVSPWLRLGTSLSFDKQNDDFFSTANWGFLVGNPRFGTLDQPWRTLAPTRLLERLNFGVTFQNIPIRSGELFDFSGLFGLSYLFPQTGLLLNTGYHVQKGDDSFHLGFGYEIMPSLKLFAGLSDFEPENLGLGLSYTYDKFNLSLAYSATSEKVLLAITTRISPDPPALAKPYLMAGRRKLRAHEYKSANRDFKKYLAFELQTVQSDSVRSIVEALDERIERNEYRVDSLLTAASRYLASNGEPKYLRAAYLYNRVLRLDPDNEIATVKLQSLRPLVKRSVKKFVEDGVFKFENKQYFEAQKQFNRVLIFEPENVTARNYLARIDRVLQDMSEEHFYRGVGFYRQKDYHAAKTEFERALKFSPNLSEARSYLQRTEDKIAGNQERVSRLMTEGHALEQQKKYYEATNKYLAVLNIMPANKEARSRVEALRPKIVRFVNSKFNEGMRYYRQGDYQKAQATLQSVLSIDPQHKAARRNLKKLLAEKNARVADYLKQAAAATSKNRFREAISLYGKILSIDPGQQEAMKQKKRLEKRLQIGDMLEKARKKVREQKYVEAIRIYDDVLALEPRNQVAKFERTEAQHALDDVVERHFNQGINLYTQDKYEEAIKVMDEVLQIKPDHQGALEYRRQALERLKALQKLKRKQ